MLELSRRNLLGGILTAIAVPAIIRTPGLLMAVKAVPTADNTLTVTWNEVPGATGYHIYGRSPAMDALPDIRELQVRMRDLLVRRTSWRSVWSALAEDMLPREVVSDPSTTIATLTCSATRST